jgi:hypothetical protein
MDAGGWQDSNWQPSDYVALWMSSSTNVGASVSEPEHLMLPRPRVTGDFCLPAFHNLS